MIGPFAGSMTAFHTLVVSKINGILSIVDKVQVGKEEEDLSLMMSCCCGVMSAMVRQGFVPRLQGHI